MSEIDLTYFSLSDEELLEQRNKQEEKLKRYLNVITNQQSERLIILTV